MRANALSWSPTLPTSILLASEDHNIYTFDVRSLTSPTQIYKGHVAAVMSCDWGPTGTEFVSGGWDRTIRIWKEGEGRGSEAYHTKRMQRYVLNLVSLTNVVWLTRICWSEYSPQPIQVMHDLFSRGRMMETYGYGRRMRLKSSGSSPVENVQPKNIAQNSAKNGSSIQRLGKSKGMHSFTSSLFRLTAHVSHLTGFIYTSQEETPTQSDLQYRKTQADNARFPQSQGREEKTTFSCRRIEANSRAEEICHSRTSIANHCRSYRFQLLRFMLLLLFVCAQQVLASVFI